MHERALLQEHMSECADAYTCTHYMHARAHMDTHTHTHTRAQEEPLWHEKGPRGPHARHSTMMVGDEARRTISHSLGGRGAMGGYPGGGVAGWVAGRG